MNLAETAFLHPQGADYSLRWFTPTIEVDLCGHATLASAHVLWEEGHLAPRPASALPYPQRPADGDTRWRVDQHGLPGDARQRH
jgi:PhzF family phenazine biosynthesis protein